MASSAAGAVSNIRAMFEAKKEHSSSSPPSRGRSPSGNSDINSIRSISSRPVSKIRKSFVAVEKSGEMGGPIIGLRRISDVQDKVENERNSRPSITDNAVGESIADESKGPEKEKSFRDNMTKGDISTQNSERKESKVNGSRVVGEKSLGLKGKATAKKQVPPAIKTSVSKIQTSKVATSAVPLRKQPTTPKGGLERSRDVKKPAAISTKPVASGSRTVIDTKSRASVTDPNTPISATKPVTKWDALPTPVRTPRTSLVPSDLKENKFIKPKPRSPTRPVRLPAGAIASTTASAAKNVAEVRSSSGSTKPRTSTDGDFLARMMRPTAASASKTHEKLASKIITRNTIIPRPKRMSEAGKLSLPKPVTSKSDVATPSSNSKAEVKESDGAKLKADETQKLSTALDQVKSPKVENLNGDSGIAGSGLELSKNQVSIQSASEEGQNEEASIMEPDFNIEGFSKQDIENAKTFMEFKVDKQTDSHRESDDSEIQLNVSSSEHTRSPSNKNATEALLGEIENEQLESGNESEDKNKVHDILELTEDADDKEAGDDTTASEFISTEMNGNVNAEIPTQDHLSEQSQGEQIKGICASDNTKPITKEKSSKEILLPAMKSPKQDTKAPEAIPLPTTPNPPANKKSTITSEAELPAKIKEEEDETS